VSADLAALWETQAHVEQAAADGHWFQQVWYAEPGQVVAGVEGDGPPDDDVYAPECGFSGCFVGWRAHLDGAELRDGQMVLPDGRVLGRGPDGRALGRGPGQPWVDWDEWARERFGLSETAVYLLSETTNTIDDLHRIIEQIERGQLG
jgi:hypothetical protein